jgi:hypothetical protein
VLVAHREHIIQVDVGHRGTHHVKDVAAAKDRGSSVPNTSLEEWAKAPQRHVVTKRGSTVACDIMTDTPTFCKQVQLR